MNDMITKRAQKHSSRHNGFSANNSGGTFSYLTFELINLCLMILIHLSARTYSQMNLPAEKISKRETNEIRTKNAFYGQFQNAKLVHEYCGFTFLLYNIEEDLQYFLGGLMI